MNPTKTEKVNTILRAVFGTDEVETPLMRQLAKRYMQIPTSKLDPLYKKSTAYLKAVKG